MTLFGVEIWGGVVAFVRIGAIFMLLAGFGEQQIPTSIRLAAALLLTLVIAPALGAQLPREPAEFATAVQIIIWEALIGLAIGSVSRILQTALTTAGQIIGFESGLAFAQVQSADINQAGQVIGVFYSLLGVALIFITGVHQLLIAAIAASYQMFPPAAPPPFEDFTAWAVQATSEAFLLGARIAAPVMLAGVIFRVASAVLARLTPQVQVFFIGLPLNVALGLAVVALSLSSGMLIWLDRMQDFALELR